MQNWFTKERTLKESTRNIAVLLALVIILTYLIYLVDTKMDSIQQEAEEYAAANKAEVTATMEPAAGAEE